jgi:hypothetical protein
MESDAVYYSRRAREERQAAVHAPLRGVRERHIEMAQAYELRARFLLKESQPPEIIEQPMPIAHW